MLDRLGHIPVLQQRLLLIVGCAVLFFLWWSAVPLTEWDEARYCASVREMITQNDYVIPSYNFIERYQKPILYYWVQASGVSTLGMTEWAARLPSGVLTLVLVLLVHLLLYTWLPARALHHGDRVRGRGAAFLAAAVLAVMPFTVVWARGATTDATTTVCTSLALLALLQADLVSRASVSRHRGHHLARVWYCVAAAACGLAFLVKGPVGPLVPVLVWLVYHGLNRELRAEARRVPWLLAVPIFVLVAAPWYAMTVQANGWGFLKRFFLTENLDRFAKAHEGHSIGTNLPPLIGRILGLVTYYPVAALLAFPATPLAVREMIVPFTGNAEAAQDAILPRIRRFALVWIFTDIVLLSLARTQLPSYIHAIIGGVALLVGVHLYARFTGEAATGERHFGARVTESALWVGLGAVFAAAVAGVASQGKMPGVLGWYAFPQPAATVLAALGVVIGVVFIGGVIVANRRKNPSLTVGLPLAIWPALLVVFMATAIMAIRSGYGPTRDVGAFVARQPDDYRVLVYRPKVAESLVYYMARERAVEFYYLTRVQGQPEPRLRAAGDGRRYDGYAPSWWPKTEEYTRAFWQTLDALRANGETAIVVTDATGEARIKAIAPDAVKVYEGGSAVVLKVRPTVPAPAAPAAPTPPTP